VPKADLDRLYVQIAGLIRARREDAGLTQEELGRRVGLTRGSITNLESARQRVQLDKLFEIAEALGVPLAALLPAPAEGERLEIPGEALRGLPAGAREWVQEMMVLPAGGGGPVVVAGLEKLKKLRDYVAGGGLETGIPNLCTEVRVLSGVSGTPIPVEQAAQGLGILIRYGPAAPGVEVALYQANTSALIAVNSLRPAARQRFALAHSLGHAILHDRVVTIDTGFPDSEGDEGAANAFAAELLVPVEGLWQELGGKAVDYEDDEEVRPWAEKYKVSARVMAGRLAAAARL